MNNSLEIWRWWWRLIRWIRNDGNLFAAFVFMLMLWNFSISHYFQLNSPNRILLLHLSVVCLSLSVLYLWILINNSITQLPLNRFNIATIPESAAITTATSSSTSSRSNHFYRVWSGLGDDVTTLSPLAETLHDSVCSVNDLLIHLLQPIGLWTICCINFDRYYAICSPLHYNTLFTTKKVSVDDFNWRQLRIN